MGKINKKRIKPRENYRLKNWSAYNNSLKNRGKITIWLGEEAKNNWIYKEKRESGGKIVYSDVAIEFCLTIKHLYNLGYRQTEGFVSDMFKQLKIELPIPSYTQMHRRSKSLKINMRVNKRKKGVVDLVIDSTGLKVYGEGEWKVRKHGWSKHRTWKKLHMGSDGWDLEIISVIVTGNEVDDAEAGKEVIGQTEALVELRSVAGDGAYDKKKFRGCLPINTEQLIPPQNNAVLSNSKSPNKLRQRDESIKRIKEIGREAWKKEKGYHIIPK